MLPVLCNCSLGSCRPRVVAVFATGQDWQFKGWRAGRKPDRPDITPAEIFERCESPASALLPRTRTGVRCQRDRSRLAVHALVSPRLTIGIAFRHGCRRRLLPRLRERHAARKHRQVAREASVCVSHEAVSRRGRCQRVLGGRGRPHLCEEAVPPQALLLVVGVVSCKWRLRELGRQRRAGIVMSPAVAGARFNGMLRARHVVEVLVRKTHELGQPLILREIRACWT